jgi:hypothetical protein
LERRRLAEQERVPLDRAVEVGDGEPDVVEQ